MALLHVLAQLRQRARFSLSAHGVDHGLRPEASGELQLAKALCEHLEVPFSATQLSLRDGANLQARARTARYEALREQLRRVPDVPRAPREAPHVFLVTAHHADDRAETVLMRLLRGAGPRGLAVLAPRCGDLLRPMVRARRADVMAHLARHSLPYALDPSNDNRRFLRARVRHELLPLLETLSPKIVTHLVSLADALGDTSELGLDAALGALPQLGRAQRLMLEEATRRHHRGVRIALSDELDLALDPRSGAPVLTAAIARRTVRRAAPPEST